MRLWGSIANARRLCEESGVRFSIDQKFFDKIEILEERFAKAISRVEKSKTMHGISKEIFDINTEILCRMLSAEGDEDPIGSIQFIESCLEELDRIKIENDLRIVLEQEIEEKYLSFKRKAERESDEWFDWSVSIFRELGYGSNDILYDRGFFLNSVEYRYLKYEGIVDEIVEDLLAKRGYTFSIVLINPDKETLWLRAIIAHPFTSGNTAIEKNIFQEYRSVLV